MRPPPVWSGCRGASMKSTTARPGCLRGIMGGFFVFWERMHRRMLDRGTAACAADARLLQTSLCSAKWKSAGFIPRFPLMFQFFKQPNHQTAHSFLALIICSIASYLGFNFLYSTLNSSSFNISSFISSKDIPAYVLQKL